MSLPQDLVADVLFSDSLESLMGFTPLRSSSDDVLSSDGHRIVACFSNSPKNALIVCFPPSWPKDFARPLYHSSEQLVDSTSFPKRIVFFFLKQRERKKLVFFSIVCFFLFFFFFFPSCPPRIANSSDSPQWYEGRSPFFTSMGSFQRCLKGL